MATTFMDRQKTQLVKKLHTLSGKAGMDREAYLDFLWNNYKVNSSTEMNVYELTEACGALDKMANPHQKEMDKWRKRAIASIGGWLKVAGMPNNNIDYIKAIACRSTGCETFNQIPKERLANLYYSFKNKQKDAENVRVAKAELLVLAGRMN